MKKLKMTYASCFLGLFMLLVGAQSSFALKCEGKIYFQPLKSWTQAYIYASGQHIPGKATDGWFVFDAARVGGPETVFIFNNTGKDCPVTWFTRTSTSSDQKNDASMFSCSDFEGGETLYIFPNPSDTTKAVVSTEPPKVKRLHVLLPGDDVEWMVASPLISFDGSYKNSNPLAADPDNCGWFTYTWFNQDVADNVLFIRDDDTKVEHAVGAEGLNAETATPIDLSMWFDILETNDLYFVLDDGVWDDFDLRATSGFSSKADSTLEGACEYKLAAIIYDTDASLHPAFSCYSAGGEGCQKGAQSVSEDDAVKAVQACSSVTPGLVEETLGSDKKPVLSKDGEKCFISKKFFNQLFNYIKGVNEMSCFDVPFRRSSDGKWEFDSDNFQSAGTSVKGGFYPVENSTNESVLLAKPDQTPVPAARTKRLAQGPIFYGPILRALDSVENVPVIDVFCNGPGWNKGHDCAGLFGDGDKTTAAIKTALKMTSTDCVIGWSCPDKGPSGWQFYKDGTETPSVTGSSYWMSKETADGTGGRNQHFCLESHAKFRYRNGLRFSIRGDNDIWVYINNKLAVDIGGTHMAAPGYVDLDMFNKDGTMKSGEMYDIDIFSCDRRTTSSDIRIKTNMYFEQTANLKIEKGKKDAAGGVYYAISYAGAGDGSCASVALGGLGETVSDDELVKITTIDYHIEDADSKIVVPVADLATAETHCGGIDLSNRAVPVINTALIKGCNLKPGKYNLVVTVKGLSRQIPFRLADGVDAIAKSVRPSMVQLSVSGRIMQMSLENARADYSVMDLQGRVIAKGVLQSRATVAVPMAGTYLVKIGSEVRKVNVR